MSTVDTENDPSIAVKIRTGTSERPPEYKEKLTPTPILVFAVRVQTPQRGSRERPPPFDLNSVFLNSPMCLLCSLKSFILLVSTNKL